MAWPSTRSAWPYMGEESKKSTPRSIAVLVIVRACASSRAPRTSNVCHVPMPTTGTSSPVAPSVRRIINEISRAKDVTSAMNRILVIGGTGNVGGLIAHQLLATGAPFRVMTRDPDAARVPPQVEVVRGDLTVPETLDRCLENIETVFLVWVAPAAAAPRA